MHFRSTSLEGESLVDQREIFLQYAAMRASCCGEQKVRNPETVRSRQLVMLRDVVGFAVALVAVLLLSSCTKANPVVCCDDPSDCASIGLNTENERLCEGELRCLDHVCTEVTVCLIDSDCAGSVPICDTSDGTCVECLADPDCTGDLPRCSEDRRCVECLSSADCSIGAPVCDLNTQACKQCQLDDECSSNVCDAEMGTCVEESSVVYADPAGPTSTECSKETPCSITSAFAVANVAREIVKLNPGTYSADIVVSNKKVTVHGDGATLTSTTAPLSADNRARLRVIGLLIVKGSGLGSGFDCGGEIDQPIVELDRVTIDSQKIAVAAKCNLTISRSHIHVTEGSIAIGAADGAVVDIRETLIDGDGGNGIEAFQGSVVRLHNSIIIGQNGDEGGALLATAATIFVSYSTIIDSVVDCGIGLINCNPGSSDGICVDNSIIFNAAANAADSVVGSKCKFDYTLASPQTTTLGGVGNQLGVDPMFVNAAAGDFHLQSSSPAVDAADPASSNTSDFEGTLRPQGSANDLGAFESH